MKTLKFQKESTFNLAVEILHQAVKEGHVNYSLDISSESLTLTIVGLDWEIDSGLADLSTAQIWPVASFKGTPDYQIIS